MFWHLLSFGAMQIFHCVTQASGSVLIFHWLDTSLCYSR